MIYNKFVEAIDGSIIASAICFPKNLRQFYADQLMLLRVSVEFGVNL